MNQMIGEKNLVRAADLVELIELCPAGTLSDSRRSQLGSLAASSADEGESATALAETFRARLSVDTPNRKLTQDVAAAILLAAGRLEDCLSFLPTLDSAIASADLKNLNLYSQVLVSLHQQKPDRQRLEQAWTAVQAILAVPPQPPAPAVAPVPAPDPAAPTSPLPTPPCHDRSPLHSRKSSSNQRFAEPYSWYLSSAGSWVKMAR
ncbi:MAG UNVERIFIED_CONTAM: hypothetical protein LVR18_41140 [Planctomycetaceae bacterium]|jgi:hypothetical protein